MFTLHLHLSKSHRKSRPMFLHIKFKPSDHPFTFKFINIYRLVKTRKLTTKSIAIVKRPKIMAIWLAIGKTTLSRFFFRGLKYSLSYFTSCKNLTQICQHSLASPTRTCKQYHCLIYGWQIYIAIRMGKLIQAEKLVTMY